MGSEIWKQLNMVIGHSGKQIIFFEEGVLKSEDNGLQK